MADTDTISVIAESVASAAEPLSVALTSPDTFNAFMQRLGWNTNGYIKEIQDLGNIASNLTSLVANGLDSAQVQQVISTVVSFFNAVQNLNSASGLPPTIDALEFAADFPQQLTDYLIADFFLTQNPVIGGFLLAAGVITRTEKPAAGKRPAYQRLDIAWDAIGNLLHDALATFSGAYGWGTATFQQQLFLDNMDTLGQAMGLMVFPQPIGARLKAILDQGAISVTSLQDSSLRWRILGTNVEASKIEVGIDLLVLPPTASASPGVAISPYVNGLAGLTLDITDTISLALRASFDFASGLLVGFRPGQGVTVQTNLIGSPALGGDFSFALQLHSEDGTKVLILGSSTGSRLEYGDLELTVGTRTTKDGQSFYVEAGIVDGDIVISPGSDADGFIASLLPSDLRVDASVTIGFDSKLGVYLSGSSGLEIQIPAHISLGPLEILSATISSKPSGNAVPIDFGATFEGALGPLSAEVDNIGLTVDLTFPGNGGNIGPIDAALRFKPPNGVGLSLDAGVIQGGGFLYIDAARGEYAGALQLIFADFLGLQAIGLITTKMPDGSSGFSLLIIITVDFGAGIQLGFGFTLLAVGGLLGLNRSMLFQPLMDGIRTDSIESIMFPQDVIANAPRIISDLRAIFPPQQGTFLVGPMAKLGWGEPTLISLALGIIIEIPPGDIAILGILKLALPADDIAVLLLQVNFAGALEFDKQRLYFFASLFDSHILFITLEGEMGLLMAWGDNANFVVSIGGFHPQFNPPPLPFPSPKRIEVDIINESYARIRCDGYFAVTTNTVQFGTHSEYFFGFSALNLSGSSGFDALIQFSPFHFIAEISTSFSVNVFGVGCYGIDMDLTLEGPTPWHAHGTASISLLFFSIGINVDFTWGDSRNTMLPPIAVMPILSGEFEKQSNWKAVLPSGSNLLVTLRQLDPSESDMVLHPVGTLHVSQRAVPLDLTLDKDGNQQPSDANYFKLDVTSGGLTKTQTLQEPFAPAQFTNMDDATKLSQPAFVPLDSGIELSATGNAYASGTAITRNVRYDLTVIDTKLRRVFRRFYVYTGSLFAHFLNGSSVTRSVFSAQRAAQSQPYSDHVAVNTETFAVAMQTNNKIYNAQSGAFSSQAAAQDYLSRAVASDPTLAGTLHVLPQFEVAA